MDITLLHFLILSVLIFVLGMVGIVVNRRNLIVVLMSIELVLLAANIAFVAFARLLHGVEGEVFTLFILAIAAAEAAIGLAIVMLFFRLKRTIALTEMQELRG